MWLCQHGQNNHNYFDPQATMMRRNPMSSPIELSILQRSNSKCQLHSIHMPNKHLMCWFIGDQHDVIGSITMSSSQLITQPQLHYGDHNYLPDHSLDPIN
eukprot:c34568_g1_i1 orf=882-1181(-)